MKLTKNSEFLLAFFTKNKCVHGAPQTKTTKELLIVLYHEIIKASNYVKKIKQERGSNFYDVKVKKINSVSQITRPKSFNSDSFPELVRKHIDELSLFELTYDFSLLDRKIKLHFILEDANVIEKYNNYVDAIIMWLCILNEYGSKKCASSLSIYFYFTSLEKRLPNTNIDIFDRIHVNTAFTTTCPRDSEIVIFRKEEWFKAFIHETFHNFALDFSDMNTNECNKKILSIFDVKTEVNLYESYTEFWAEIMNALFCSYFALKNKNDMATFMVYTDYFINLERNYSFFQLVKTLQFMNLNYKNLYSRTKQDGMLRDAFYKEKTNVLSYYVIKTVLINNYQSFLSWCNNNNLSLLQFKKTTNNLNEFCNFIQNNYKTKTMIENVKSAEKCYDNLKKNYSHKKKSINYLMTNMRMSICELG
jgi:hypothetical protein